VQECFSTLGSIGGLALEEGLDQIRCVGRLIDEDWRGMIEARLTGRAIFDILVLLAIPAREGPASRFRPLDVNEIVSPIGCLAFVGEARGWPGSLPVSCRDGSRRWCGGESLRTTVSRRPNQKGSPV
jgi:hypothetical protein